MATERTWRRTPTGTWCGFCDAWLVADSPVQYISGGKWELRRGVCCANEHAPDLPPRRQSVPPLVFGQHESKPMTKVSAIQPDDWWQK